MAILFGWIIVGSLIGLAVMQSTFVWMYCRFLQTNPVWRAQDSDPKQFLPRVAIVLCLRGADPSLVDCLTGLFSLNYAGENKQPKYEIHFVVDDKQDPALDIVTQFITNNPTQIKTKTHVLDPTDVQGSLKCTAIVTAISTFEGSAGEAIDVVALVDADAKVDADWLNDLVQPLADLTVGASTGNRWFAPIDSGLGSLVRQTWNAAAIAQMSFYQIPWGGSLALRLSTIHDCGLLERWSKAFCEDTMLKGVLTTNNLQVARVPNLILASDESIRFKDAYRWIGRQLLTVRLYHRDWPMVFAHGMFVGFCLIGGIFSATWLLALSQWVMAVIVLGSSILFQAINLILIGKISRGNEAHIRRRSPGSLMKSPSLGTKLVGAFVTQLVQPIAALSAVSKKKVSWRGVDYKIGAKKSIELVRYVPYREIENETDSSHSID